jgi:hypothetical protein
MLMTMIVVVFADVAVVVMIVMKVVVPELEYEKLTNVMLVVMSL